MTKTLTLPEEMPKDHANEEPGAQPTFGQTDVRSKRKPPLAHPYDNLDRACRAVLVRTTGGVSPYSIMVTWMDWALHLSRSPGRQLELAERATTNAAKLAQHAFGRSC